ncbi:MAG: NACHT domain-containing protein [Cyanobacteria bacterium P01_F01_bin.53]
MSIPPAEQTYKIFHRSDIGGRLLILGEPGAGKTTELLTVAQRLVEAAMEDDTQPIPLVFELSSWTPNIPIVSWLGQQFQTSYGISKKLAEPLSQQWVQQSRIIPLLDGLDELGQRNQIACIEALENFLSQHPALPAVVCCRREDYEQGGEQLKQLNGAVYLQAVGPPQIQQYLQDLGREPLWEGIQATPELLKLAQSPLFLTMLVVVYQGQPIRDQSALFNAYIQKQLHDPSHQGTYKPGKAMSHQQTLHYLGWLARQLNKRKEAEFLIENLQPDWFEVKQQHRTYRLIVGLIVGLIFGLIVGFFFGFFGGLIFGLFGGLIFGLSIGLFFGLSDELNKIELQEQLKWSLRRGLSDGLFGGLFLGLIVGLVGGLGFGLVGGLSSGLVGGLSVGLNVGLFLGLIFGLFGGLGFGLVGGLSNEAIEQKQVPNQGIKKSIKNGLIFGLFGGLSVTLIGGLVFGLSGRLFGNLMNSELIDELIGGLLVGLIGGLIGGLISGLIGGLEGAIKHLSLRICLTKNGDTPWNYAQFLDHATRHRFIQRTGGRYRFVHDLLRQHFAQITPEQQADLAQPTNSNRL